jgi:hypothetical protein
VTSEPKSWANRSAYSKAFCDAGEKSVGASIFFIAIAARSVAGLATEVRDLAGRVARASDFIAGDFGCSRNDALSAGCQSLCVFCADKTKCFSDE